MTLSKEIPYLAYFVRGIAESIISISGLSLVVRCAKALSLESASVG